MSGTTTITARVDAERERLLTTLRDLDPAQWQVPSLCARWSVRDVVVHLLMPYELSVPRFLALMLRSRLDFDRAADRWATTDRRSPAELIAALEATADERFNVPGSPPQAPLSHLVSHVPDVCRPLGVPSPVDPESARIVLDHVMTLRRGVLTPDLLEGLALVATDSEWTSGRGLAVRGTGISLLTTLSGRTAALPDLEGPGADRLRERLGG